MTRKQHYMTRDERVKLEALHRAKVPVAQIARQLGFCRTTIYNELKRGAYVHTCPWWDEVRYSAEKGEQLHRQAVAMKGGELKIGRHRDYADFLERKILRDKFSPAAALAAAREKGFAISVCVSTLYSYIEKGVFLHLTNKDLWEKSKQKTKEYKPVRRVAHPKLPSIGDRPEYVNERQEFGHWEMDLVVGPSGSQAALLTLTERASRKELLFKLPDKRAASVRRIFDRLERQTPDFREVFKSITTDNGPEFLEYEKLCRSVRGGKRFEVWYCHSYSAWEKGCNENHNRMVRRWFPKGTAFEKVTKKRIAEVQEWMNGYPRKVLGWACPRDFCNTV